MPLFEPLETRVLMSVQPAASATTPLLTQLPVPQLVSTVPGNGDVNPYGIAFVPDNFPGGGKLAAGDTLVANFNNNQNAQGTGTTITLIDGAGNTSTFFQGSAGLGLDAGLSILSSGYVLVGNVPATGNNANPVGAGSILILDKNGNQVGTVPNTKINGPWDFTALPQTNGNTVLFISNALSGTVERLTISPITQSGATLVSETQIGSGYIHGPSAAAFVLGPAGVAYDAANGTLYVNGEGDDTVFAIPNALTTTTDNGTGTAIFQDPANLHGPLGLILASNGDLILANSDGVNADPNHPSELVEITTKGALVTTKFIDPNNGGAFNIAESFSDNMHRFAYVDDNTNMLTTWTLASTASSTAPLLPQLIAPQNISTVPSNGDVNPYGIAFVPDNFPTGGKLAAGDILVANFNNSQNAQGTGTTITQFHPAGNTTTFFQGSAGLGLDAGLAILSKGFVLVGNVPATGNTASPVGAGSILILDKNGNQVGQITGSFIQGPWDFTAVEQNGGKTVQLFVSNALTGTVDRVTLTLNKNGSNFKVGKAVQIASGYTHGPNAAAFVLGPAGVAFDSANGNLYVNSEGDDAVFAIPNAMKAKKDNGKGTMTFQDNANLHGPLGLILASNGDLVLANSDGVNADPNHPSELVEITTGGQLVTTKFIDPNNGGAFNIAGSLAGHSDRVAYVDDNTNMLSIWTLPVAPTIGGQVLFDHNGSGVVSSHDQPLKGWTVYLDLNNDGMLDPGDPTAVTDGQGNFDITAPAPGTYTLREVVKKGFRETAPSSGMFSVVAIDNQLSGGNVFLNAKGK